MTSLQTVQLPFIYVFRLCMRHSWHMGLARLAAVSKNFTHNHNAYFGSEMELVYTPNTLFSILDEHAVY